MKVEEIDALIKKEDELIQNRPQTIGWELWEMGLSPKEGKRLILMGLIRVVYHSNKFTYYMIDRNAVIDFKERVNKNVTPSPSLFDDILGYDDLKTTILNMLEKDRNTGLLMVGPPASAKSMILTALENLNNAIYVTMSQTTKVGLNELILNEQPAILLLDELDKASRRDYTTLLSLMQTGIVQKTVYGNHMSEVVKTKVFAASNSSKSIPPEILSRFVVFYLPEYEPQELRNVGLHMLRNYPDEVARDIVDNSLLAGIIRDPRDFMKVTDVMKGQGHDDVKTAIDVIKKYQPRN